MKSVDQQGGERVTVTYHVPPLICPWPWPLYVGGLHWENTYKSACTLSHTHAASEIYKNTTTKSKLRYSACALKHTKPLLENWQNMNSHKSWPGALLCVAGNCTAQRFFLLINSFSLHIFLISCGISTCKTPRFAWLNILTSWLLYFQTVLLFPTIFSSFPLLESSLRLLLIHCPDGFSACQRILFPPLLVAWI